MRKDELGKRRFIRLPVPLAIVVKLPEETGPGIQGSAQNISAGGVMADFPVEMTSGSVIRIVLRTRRGPIEADCRVMWTKPAAEGIRHGLAFLETQDQNFALDLFFDETR